MLDLWAASKSMDKARLFSAPPSAETTYISSKHWFPSKAAKKVRLTPVLSLEGQEGVTPEDRPGLQICCCTVFTKAQPG